MAFSPISETPSVGKNNIYLPTLFLFIILQLPIVLSDNIVVILVFRFITGILASPTQALGGGSISDMWDARKLGYPMALYDGGEYSCQLLRLSG